MMRKDFKKGIQKRFRFRKTTSVRIEIAKLSTPFSEKDPLQVLAGNIVLLFHILLIP